MGQFPLSSQPPSPTNKPNSHSTLSTSLNTIQTELHRLSTTVADKQNPFPKPDTTPTAPPPPSATPEEITNLITRLDEHTTTLTSLRASHTSLTSSLTALQTASETTTSSLTALQTRLSSTADSTHELTQKFDKHLAVFKSRMSTIHEWTVKATQRLNENAKIGDEIQTSLTELKGAGGGGRFGTRAASAGRRQGGLREELLPLKKQTSPVDGVVGEVKKS